MPRATLPALVSLALIAGAPPAGDAVPRGPSGPAFYTPPAPLPGGAHGTALRARPLRRAAALEGASNVLLLYRSTGSRGSAIAVSGTVAVPRARAPRGGWPVVAYGPRTPRI